MKKIICLLLVLILICTSGGYVMADGPATEPQGTLNGKLKKGDIDNDGSITANDALEALYVISGIYDTMDFHINAGDLNSDGKVSARDALTVLMNIAGLQDDNLGYENYLSDINYEIPEVYKEGSSFLSEKAVGFYGADGFGKYTTGGRGGKIIEVTNLRDAGKGSLRAAVDESGPRIIVFKVSGVIYLNSNLKIQDGDVTIAGQTAPGDGITLANFGVKIACDNVILRYLSIRPGDQRDTGDGIDISGSKNVIVDHCSVSFACDETLSARPNNSGETYAGTSDKVTVQWCMISESITYSPNIGKRHGMGSLIRGAQGAKITYHHNMYSSHSSRVPMMGNYIASQNDNGNFNAEFINNTVYNWDGSAASKCGDVDENGTDIYITNMNYINNYYKQGPDSDGDHMFSEACIGNHMYTSGNMMNGKHYENQRDLVSFTNDVLAHEDNPYYKKSGMVIDTDTYFLDEPFEFSEMTGIEDAETANKSVLEYVGNSLSRDCFDAEVIKAFKNGEGSLINQTFEALGWYRPAPVSTTTFDYFLEMQGLYPARANYEAYVDTDMDGMSDVWEDAVGLDKNDASDSAAGYAGTEYTNMDVFLQFLVENPEAAIAH